jgi:hypothetical protein
LAAWLTLAWLESGAKLAQACLNQCKVFVFGRLAKDSLVRYAHVWLPAQADKITLYKT